MTYGRWLVRVSALVAAVALMAGNRVPPDASPAPVAAALDPANRDATCPACRDFYQFANGGWLKAHPIHREYVSWSHFNELSEENRQALRGRLEAAARTHPVAGTRDQKLADFYAACMDERAVDAKGAAPLHDGLVAIDAVEDLPSLLALMSRLHRDGLSGGAFFEYASMPAPADSTRTIGELSQGGLSLPDRDYYTRSDARSQTLRDDFAAHVARALTLIGEDAIRSAADARTVMRIETALAKVSVPRAQERDPKVTTNPFTVAKLAALGTAIPWAEYFATAGTPTPALNVDEPAFFKGLDTILETTPTADLKTYLRWHYLDASAYWLSKPFVNEAFSWDMTLFGVKQLEPRWKSCIRDVSATEDLLGQMFVAARFPPSAKAHAETMVRNLRAAFRADIDRVDWMSRQTKARALEKLAAMVPKIGYPEHWRDYASLTIARDDYFGDVQRVRTVNRAYDLARIGKPTNRAAWWLTPQTINANYNPANNDMTFPAAILLPPFFDASTDDALNYGAIGGFIGHEMTHGFDDQGRKYDRVGNVRDWWTPSDAKQFTTRAKCIANEYGAMEAAPGVRQIGALVTGEAIADLGGLRIAYSAYERSLAGKPRRTINGYTPEQRFFLAFATVYAANSTVESLRAQGRSDTHPVNRNRVIGTLINMPEFARAFHCAARDKMVEPPATVCRIW